VLNARGRYAIAGMGETPVGKLPDISTYALTLQAVHRALADAGLQPKDVDGVICDQPNNVPSRGYALHVAHGAGITPTFATDIAMGGAAPCGSVATAIMAIEAGLATTVVCLHAQKQATGHLEPRHGSLYDGNEDFEQPFGLLGAPSRHAAAAARHMHQYGTTSAQLAAVAVAFRKHASLNATATMRKPITVEDVLNSRWICKPFHLLDCCLVSDGAGAVVVTTAERARDLPRRPVYVWGFGTGFKEDLLDSEDLTTLAGAVSSKAAYRMAGVGPEDIQFAEIYDCFTAIAMITLEDYGFCQKGEGGAFVEGGNIELGGRLPVNTHGGLLSHGHVEGMLHITEAVKQLRGGEVEPERQVPDARLGIVSGHGGNLSCHATLILSNEAA
jgi:acetyl-CoA acetyltransferase